ncbi:MAG: LptA/OstA family protein [Candidatus Omnitrophota bacterium]|nr:LptA/OstA family protein [Candidatus Omnitrophota bacterium]
MRRKNKLVFSFQLSTFSLALLLSSAAHASLNPFSKEAGASEPIIVDGDRVEYFQAQKKAVGTGNVSLKYKDIVLTSDKITVYLDTREAIAEGSVKITQKGSYFTGERINYNFDTRKSAVIDGYVASNPFYGSAKDVERPAGKDMYKLKRGYITTCDLEEPHYRVQARHVEIYPQEKIVARNILVFIGDCPVLYLPYYVQSLDENKTHITMTSGEKDAWGYYVLTATRLHFSDNNRADMLLDYRARRGIGVGLNDYYRTKEIGMGAAKFYYTHDNADYFYYYYERPGDMRPRYRWQWRHKWVMPPETGTVAVTEFNRLSDLDFIKDYFYNEYEELGDNPDNYVSVITAKSSYSMTLLARKRFGKFYDVIERLPEYTIEVPQYNIIKDKPVYYSGSASAVYLNHAFNNSNTATIQGQKDLNVARINTYNRLSYAAKLFKALNLTPYAGVRNTYYSRNKWGDTNQIRTVFDSGVDGSIKFYRLFDIQSDIMGLDINKLRHIITPTASYYHTHQPTIASENLNQFDGIDSIGTANGANFALENRLQTKRFVNGAFTSVDLATFIASTPYSFVLKKKSLAYKNHTAKFQSVDLQLELLPYSWLSAVSKMSVNTKNYAVRTETTDLAATFGENLSLGIGHRYEKADQFNKNNWLNAQVVYKINEKWKVQAYEMFNVDKSVEEQQYTVYRDLHCWQAEFTIRTRKHPRELGFWLVFTMKAFPDYPIGYRRSYAQPRFGSSAGANFGKVDTVGRGEDRMIPDDEFMMP